MWLAIQAYAATLGIGAKPAEAAPTETVRITADNWQDVMAQINAKQYPDVSAKQAALQRAVDAAKQLGVDATAIRDYATTLGIGARSADPE